MIVVQGDRAEKTRAPARRPRAVLLDVFDTMLQVAALGARFVDIGRPEHEWELFFTRTLRDGMAMTLAGGARPFADVAVAALRSTGGPGLSEAALDHVVAGFRELPPFPDVEPALQALVRARIPVYAFTPASEAVASDALDKAGLRTYLHGVLSCERIGAFPPPARVYHWACDEAGEHGDRVAFVAAHAWEVHGAVRAGLVGALATHLDGAVPDVVAPPHVAAEHLDGVVARLIALPA